jgi:hypothetical protein
MAREPTTAQEEPTSPRSPATPSHGRHENGAEERAGYLETDYMGVAATLPPPGNGAKGGSARDKVEISRRADSNCRPAHFK